MYDVNFYLVNFNNNFYIMNLFKKRYYKFKDFVFNDVFLINDDIFFNIKIMDIVNFLGFIIFIFKEEKINYFC